MQRHLIAVLYYIIYFHMYVVLCACCQTCGVVYVLVLSACCVVIDATHIILILVRFLKQPSSPTNLK